MRQLGQANGELFQPFGQIMGRCLPLKRCVHRQHHFVNAAFGNAADQSVDVQILWPDTVQCGQASAQNMIFARKKPRAVKRPQVRYILHHANGPDVAARVDANATWIASVDIATGTANNEPLLHILQRTQ